MGSPSPDETWHEIRRLRLQINIGFFGGLALVLIVMRYLFFSPYPFLIAATIWLLWAGYFSSLCSKIACPHCGGRFAKGTPLKFSRTCESCYENII